MVGMVLVAPIQVTSLQRPGHRSNNMSVAPLWSLSEMRMDLWKEDGQWQETRQPGAAVMGKHSECP